MGAAEIIGLAASVSLLAGWRLYACVLAIGIAMRLGIIELPQHLAALDVLANPWVMGIAGIGVLAELLADKIAWLDSAWDAVHTLIRPLGVIHRRGAELSAATRGFIDLLRGGTAETNGHPNRNGKRRKVRN